MINSNAIESLDRNLVSSLIRRTWSARFKLRLASLCLGGLLAVALSGFIFITVPAAAGQDLDQDVGMWCPDVKLLHNTQTVAPAPKLSSFALYADRSVQMQQANTVSGGDVGVRLAAIQGFGPQLIIKDGAKIVKKLWAPSVSLGPQVTTGGIVTYQLQPPGPTEGFPASDMPPLPLLPALPIGGAAVNVAANKSVTLAPGNYGALTVETGGKLTLSAGDFSFSSATLANSSRLAVDNGIAKIDILGRLTVQESVEIEPVGASGGVATADHLVFSVFGEDDVERPTGVAASAGKTAVFVGSKSKIKALLKAPHGTLWFGPDALASGAFAAFDIVLQDRAAVVFDTGFPDKLDTEPLQQLQGYVPAPESCASALVEPIRQSTVIRLSVSLPVRSPAQLQTFLQQVSDPKSPIFRQFLTPSQFNATYGGSVSDYGALQSWATSNGLSIIATYPDNLFLSVSGTVAHFEQALHAYLIFRQRIDGTDWVSVDREPALSLKVPVLHISGITTAVLPTPAVSSNTGTGGTFRGTDIRNAYFGPTSACAALTGAGQSVAILSSDIFNPADISNFGARQTPPITNPNVQVVAVEGGGGSGQPGFEVTLDIEMVLSMAPQAQILVYQGNSGITAHYDNILKRMANSFGPLTVVTSSIIYAQSGTAQQALDQMAAQGTSVFNASGDYGDVGDPQNNLRMNNQTLVGGTFLATNPLITSSPPVYPPNYYQGETVWNSNQPKTKDASGGGIMNGTNKGPNGYCLSFCSPVGIPPYQVGVNMAANGGSTAFRNYPDVSMIASNVEVFFNNGVTPPGAGTSFAAPLWAGFAALINQQRASQPGFNGFGMGFLNPALYDIGLTSGTSSDLYSQDFNAITTGNNSNGYGPGFSAIFGYNLATGWGSPKCALLTQLSSKTPVTPTTALPLIQFVIGTGHDNLRGKGGVLTGCGATGATATISLPSGASFNVTLKSTGDPNGWENNTTTAPLVFPVPNTGPPLTLANGIAGVSLAIQENYSSPCGPDNWDMTTLSVSLLTPANPGQPVCQLNIVGTSQLQDRHTGLFRFSNSPGNSGGGTTSPLYLTGPGSGC